MTPYIAYLFDTHTYDHDGALDREFKALLKDYYRIGGEIGILEAGPIPGDKTEELERLHHEHDRLAQLVFGFTHYITRESLNSVIEAELEDPEYGQQIMASIKHQKEQGGAQ